MVESQLRQQVVGGKDPQKTAALAQNLLRVRGMEVGSWWIGGIRGWTLVKTKKKTGVPSGELT